MNKLYILSTQLVTDLAFIVEEIESKELDIESFINVLDIEKEKMEKWIYLTGNIKDENNIEIDKRQKGYYK